MYLKKIYFFLILLFFFSIASKSVAVDWPQWRGNNRDGISDETGLIKKWPAKGPALLWSVENIGKGYSSAVIADGKIYITGMDAKKKEFMSAFDLDGNLKWRSTYGDAWRKSFPDTRTSPTVDRKYLYVVSGSREVVCLDRNSGSIVWTVDAQEKFHGSFGRW